MTNHPTLEQGVSASAGASSGARDSIQAIGAAIRRLRQERQLSLRDLSRLTDFSIGFLSQVERGPSSLAITSLEKVANALGTDMASLVSAEVPQSEGHPLPHVTRADDADEITVDGSRRTYVLLSGRAPGRVLEPILMIVQPTESVEEPYGHDGEEFLYVLSGGLVYVVAGSEYRLGPGDSIHLKSDVPHTIFNDGEEPAKAVFVVTPRFF